MLKRYLPFSRPAALVGLCLIGAWLPAIAHAQPAAPAPPPGPDDGTAWDALKKQMAGAEPQAAIDAYQKFWNTHPNMDPNIGISITLTIADLYGDKLHLSRLLFSWSADAYVVKSSDLSELKATVKRLMEEAG